jgi:hypothetical protein
MLPWLLLNALIFLFHVFLAWDRVQLLWQNIRALLLWSSLPATLPVVHEQPDAVESTVDMDDTVIEEAVMANYKVVEMCRSFLDLLNDNEKDQVPVFEFNLIYI